MQTPDVSFAEVVLLIQLLLPPPGLPLLLPSPLSLSSLLPQCLHLIIILLIKVIIFSSIPHIPDAISGSGRCCALHNFYRVKGVGSWSPLRATIFTI